MAQVPVYYASFQLGDSAGKLGSGSFRVSAADAKAYFAAADTAARAATDVGVLLAAALPLTKYASFATCWHMFEVVGRFINDAFVFPDPDDGLYNSNKWKVTFRTTNGGIPATDTLYLPDYAVTGIVMDSNGIDADPADAPVDAFIAALLDTGLSKYNTAITEVLTISRNDS